MNGVAYAWDNNGNLLSDGVNTYSYDAANRLVALSGPQSAFGFGYNGLGDRLQQITNGQSTNYTLDLNAGLTQVLDDGTDTYTYGLDRIAQAGGAGTDYFLGDALGSVRQLADQNAQIMLTQSYDPYGNVIAGDGPGASIYGYTGEVGDQSGLTYLRARYYSTQDGRFTTRDTWEGDPSYPMSFDEWEYVYGNPVNYQDATGHIAEQEAYGADFIVNFLQNHYGVRIEKDWGYRLVEADPSSLPPGILTGILYAGCEWHPGIWDFVELRTIRDAVKDLARGMNGPGGFKKFVGPVTMKKSPDACGRGCTPAWGSRDIIFLDKGKPPTNVDISNSANIDKWTVVHEMGHAWDRNYGWSRSELLMAYTNGYMGSRPSDCGPIDPAHPWTNPMTRLPGCNAAGYFYSGPPPAGSDYNFNPQEDFAESVAAFVYPTEALSRVARIVRENRNLYRPYLDYADYRETSRWKFINGLINLGAFQ